MLCYVMLRMHGCMYKDVCMYLSHRCICTCVCARACVCVCLSRMCMRMFMEKGGGLGGNGCGEERHMQKVTTMLINEPVDPLTGTLNGVPPPCSRKMSQKRPDLGYRGGTHTHTLSLSVCLPVCPSVSLSLSLPPCRGFGSTCCCCCDFCPRSFHSQPSPLPGEDWVVRESHQRDGYSSHSTALQFGCSSHLSPRCVAVKPSFSFGRKKGDWAILCRVPFPVFPWHSQFSISS